MILNYCSKLQNMMEYIRKLSTFNVQWTKTLHQNNFKHIAFLFTPFAGYKINVIIYKK